MYLDVKVVLNNYIMMYMQGFNAKTIYLKTMQIKKIFSMLWPDNVIDAIKDGAVSVPKICIFMLNIWRKILNIFISNLNFLLI